MDKIFQRLADQLYAKNSHVNIQEARTIVELLWEDFETTRAKAGREYEGSETTEKIVMRWIEQYGPNLHEVVLNNPKYEKYTKNNNRLH
ncbi:YfhJ family protein [Radiobacillus kanasensis]|uniref:YfhJ family protein n=1 Tax=Radiobacillus kanasensis TaxID=2844358 RepID=UPI001E5F274C|nr:YfhJ family protein [Radiobacillus kanasensis]UFU00067.1 YfhJ family protein [Radiobacillus kanasensis]